MNTKLFTGSKKKKGYNLSLKHRTYVDTKRFLNGSSHRGFAWFLWGFFFIFAFKIIKLKTFILKLDEPMSHSIIKI